MRQLIALLAIALVTACGFRPVYATGANANYSGPISVEPIDGRSGYMLRQALQQELAIGLPGVTGSATLTVNLTENLTRLAFKREHGF